MPIQVGREGEGKEGEDEKKEGQRKQERLLLTVKCQMLKRK